MSATTKAAPRTSEADRLRTLKSQHCHAARMQILGGEFDRACAHLNAGELIDRLARLTGRPSRLPVLALTLSGACALLAVLAWTLRLATFSDLQVSIRADTTAVQLTLARPATFGPLRGTAVDVGRLSTLTAQISDVPSRPNGDNWMRAEGADVEIKELNAVTGSRLAMTLIARPPGEPTFALRAYTTGLEGELLLQPGAMVSAGGTSNEPGKPGKPEMSARKLDGNVLDVVSFGCGECVDVPFRLDLRGSGPFAFENVPVNQVAYAVEKSQPDGTVYFVSGLRTGTIRLLDADRTEVIEPGDNLKLDIAEVRRFQIGRGAKADTFSIVYEGTVRGVSLGPVGAERDLSPSLLEFFYRQKALALLWGAAVFLWGLSAGIRRLWQGTSR